MESEHIPAPLHVGSTGFMWNHTIGRLGFAAAAHEALVVSHDKGETEVGSVLRAE
jgi:hypothetical protein